MTGSHTVPPRQCADCHVNNNYNITVTTCISCHQNDYNNATTPVPHTGFPTTCEQCHDTVHWTDGKFDHSTTGFTLTGMHTVPPRPCIGLPRQQQLHLEQHRLCDLPPEGLSGYDQPEPRYGGLPADLRDVPQHIDLAECDVQPQQHRLPADRACTPCRRASARTATSTTTTR